MQTFRKLPNTSPRAKITTVISGSTVLKCPIFLGLPDYSPVGWEASKVRRSLALCPPSASPCQQTRSGNRERRVGCGDRFVDRRQEDRKHGPSPPTIHPAAHPDHAPVLFHDTAADPQSDSGTRFLLGGKERLENPAQRLARDAAAVVGNRDA